MNKNISIHLPMTRKYLWNELVLFFTQLLRSYISGRGWHVSHEWLSLASLPLSEWMKPYCAMLLWLHQFWHMLSTWLWVQLGHRFTPGSTRVHRVNMCERMQSSLSETTFVCWFPADRKPSICSRWSFPFSLTHFLWLDALNKKKITHTQQH